MYRRPCRFFTRRIFEQSIGVRVSATKDDTTTAPAIAIPNSLNSRPVVPCRKASGENTATSAIVVAITAKTISRVPSIAACFGSCPSSSWCRYAFSRTMIASSTTIPIARISASSVRLLIVKPSAYMTPNAAMIDVGMARPGMSVARRFRRKTKMMMTTRIAARTSVSSASRIDARTKSALSKPFTSSTPGGSEARMTGRVSSTASDTSTRLALDWRTTPTPTDCWPL